MAERPIKYSELIIPDDSIKKLVEQLDTLKSKISEVDTALLSIASGLKTVAGATNEGREATKKAADETARLASAKQKLEQAESEQAIELQRVNALTREQIQVNKLIVQSENAAVGSLQQLEASYALLAIELSKYTAVELEQNKVAQAKLAQMQQLRVQIDKTNAAMGKSFGAFGTYKKGWDGLGNSISQMTRELPTLAISANMFFLAISNNLPIMVDELNRAKIANAALAAANKATVPLWKQVGSSLFSWNTLLMVGVSLLTVYGGQIITWIGQLGKAKKAINETENSLKYLYLAQNLVNKTIIQGSKDAVEETTRLKLLYRAATNHKESLKERYAAANEIIRQYPEYFNGLTAEQVMVGNATIAYKNLTTSILESARAKAAEEKIIENEKKLLDLTPQVDQYKELAKLDEDRVNRLITERDRLNKKYFDEFSRDNKERNAENSKNYQIYVKLVEDAEKIRDTNAKKYNYLLREQRTLLEANKKLTENIKPSKLITPPKLDNNNENEDLELKTLENKVKEIDDILDITKKGSQEELTLLKKKYDAQYNLEIYKNKKRATDAKLEENAIYDYFDGLKIDAQKTFNDELNKQDLESLKVKKGNLQLELDAVEKNTQQELDIKLKLIDIEKNIALRENELLATNLQLDRSKIDEKYNKLRADATMEFQTNVNAKNLQTAIESEYNIRKYEIAAMDVSENEKTNLLLKAEKTRMEKLMKLHQDGLIKLTDEEIASMKNFIKKGEAELKSKNYENVLDMFFPKMSEDKKKAILDATNFAMNQLKDLAKARIDAADAAVEQADKEVGAAQSRLDKEMELRDNGYAYNITMAQKELDQAKKNQDKALKEQERAKKAEIALDAALQMSSLVTASANLLKKPGLPFAIPLIALMWGTFAAAKIKAVEMVKAKKYAEGGLEFLDGGSHSSGNDIFLGNTNDGKQRRAEGGETLAIIRKSQTKKYKKILPDIISSLNKGVFESKYMKAFDTDSNLNVSYANINLNKIEKDLSDIKNNNSTKYITDGKGRTIKIYKNLKQIYNG